MAINFRGAVIHLAAGRTTTGHWCPHCNLPSGIEIEFSRLSESGVTPRFVVITYCYDCGARIPSDQEAAR